MIKFLLIPLFAAGMLAVAGPAQAMNCTFGCSSSTPKTPAPATQPEGGSGEVGDPFILAPFGKGKGATRTTVPPEEKGDGPLLVELVPLDPDNGGGAPGGFLKPQKKGTPTTPGDVANAGGGNGGGSGAGSGTCGNDLGRLKSVRASAVRAVGYGDNVDIIPICIDKSLSSVQDNVEGLRAPISQNETLTAALRREGFAADNVVGVVIANQMVELYVYN